MSSFLIVFVLVNGYCQAPLFTNQLPVGSDNNASYELGMKFKTTEAGQISKIRYYKVSTELGDPANPTGDPVMETGLHIGRIWSVSGELIDTVVFENETKHGWQEAVLQTPLKIRANTVYIVSVNANKGYGFDVGGLRSAVVNGSIMSVADDLNGVHSTTPGKFPTITYYQANYFRDVVFVGNSSIEKYKTIK